MFVVLAFFLFLKLLTLNVNAYVQHSRFQNTPKISQNSNQYTNMKMSPKTKMFLSKYSISLDLKPLRTKSISSAIGFAIGEIISQLLLKKIGEINLYKVYAIASFGALIHGPLGNIFYTRLNKAIPEANVKAVTQKIIVDQLLYTPFLSSLLVLYFGGFILKLPLEVIMKTWSFLIPKLLVFSWTLWPISHFINFSIVPARFRLLFINLIQLINNIFVSKTLSLYF